MTSPENKTRAVAVPFVIFVLAVLLALGLLIVAFTIWLSYLLDSAILSCVVVGVALLVMAMVLYLISLRGVVKRMQERLETVYQTSRVVKSGFDWVNEKVERFWS